MVSYLMCFKPSWSMKCFCEYIYFSRNRLCQGRDKSPYFFISLLIINFLPAHKVKKEMLSLCRGGYDILMESGVVLGH